MNFVESFNLLGLKAKQIPCIKGKGEPTTTTEGAVGCFYIDTLVGTLYKCTNASDGSYVWQTFEGEKGDKGEKGDTGAGVVSLVTQFPESARTLYTPLSVNFIQGAVSPTDGSEAASNVRISSEYLEIANGLRIMITDQSFWYWTRVFDENKNFLGTAAYINGTTKNTAGETKQPNCYFDIENILTVFPTAKYVRIVLKYSNNSAIKVSQSNVLVFETKTIANDEITISLDEIFYSKPQKMPYYPDDIEFEYNIDSDNMYKTRGIMKLPTNYTQNGEAIPLIVFVHGSGDFDNYNSTNITNTYNDYYNYLRDCGYAVFDCFGWGNKYHTTASSTYGTPTNNACYLNGIKYVCDNYNIDKDNIFVACKSLGGIQALSLCYQNSIHIKACGMLAPELDLLAQGIFGYTKKARINIAQDLGFTGNWQSVIDVEDADFDRTACREYLLTQIDKISANNAFWKNLLLSPEVKFHMSDTTAFDSYDLNAFRTCSVPIKIWVAEDDGLNVKSNFLVKTLLNTGCSAELRMMPAGTGAHHAVDSDPNALQTPAVTTKLGIYYESIPTAYYELEKYFSNFLLTK